MMDEMNKGNVWRLQQFNRSPVDLRGKVLASDATAFANELTACFFLSERMCPRNVRSLSTY